MEPDVVVGVIVHGERILVQPRRGDPGLAGVWELPGGKVAAGEERRAALAREVLEETGLAVEVGALLVAHGTTYPDRRVTLYAYLCTPVGGEPPAAAEWLTPEEVRARPSPAANPPILDALAWHARRGPGLTAMVRPRTD